MIDIKLIRETPDTIKQSLLRKGADCNSDIDRIVALDTQRRTLIAASETDKAEQNKASKQIPQIKKGRRRRDRDNRAIKYNKRKDSSCRV